MDQKPCPKWAIEMIEHLRQMEILLGNLPKEKEWSSQMVDNVFQRSFAVQGQTLSEETAQIVFAKIVKGLHQEGYSTDAITTWLNERLSHGRLKYCDRSEVEECLLIPII